MIVHFINCRHCRLFLLGNKTSKWEDKNTGILTYTALHKKLTCLSYNWKQKLNQRSILPAKYQECIAKLPNDIILAREDNPWIMPNFLFMAASFGFDFATSTFFYHPTSSPILFSRSTLCLWFIICIRTTNDQIINYYH